MLDFIGIENFGCFPNNHCINFGKLNVIVGKNVSGKSTIFKALNLFRIYLKSPKKIFWESDYYSLVDFGKAAYDPSQQIRITTGSDNEQVTLVSDKERISLHDKDNKVLSHYSPSKLDSITYIGPCRNVIPNQVQVGRDFRTQTTNTTFTDQIQDIYPDGRNMIRFLVEKWTAQVQEMILFEDWLRKIDPQIELFAVPIVEHSSSLSLRKKYGEILKSINMHFEGNGLQNVITIIAAVVFSPKHSTIIIEEPESHQHASSIEILVDLFNYAVNTLDKQIIIVTHSFEILNTYCSDIGNGTDRGSEHVKAKQNDFKLFVIDKDMIPNKISEYDLKDKKYTDVRKYFKVLLG